MIVFLTLHCARSRRNGEFYARIGGLLTITHPARAPVRAGGALSKQGSAKRIRGLRKEALARKLDPNVWFDNVERVAAEHIGRETVQYVSNIYKYYIAYSLVEDDVERGLEHAAIDSKKKGS